MTRAFLSNEFDFANAEILSKALPSSFINHMQMLVSNSDLYATPLNASSHLSYLFKRKTPLLSIYHSLRGFSCCKESCAVAKHSAKACFEHLEILPSATSTLVRLEHHVGSPAHIRI